MPSQQNNFTAIISSPIGKLGLQLHENKLSRIVFLPSKTAELFSNHPVITSVTQQLTAYFHNPNYAFHLPVAEFKSTPFQQRVWHALTQIPCGQTLSYGDLAKQLNTSPRAIGNACRANPIPLIVPCHRIVAKQKMGGFAGKTSGTLIQIKQWLLKHEINN